MMNTNAFTGAILVFGALISTEAQSQEQEKWSVSTSIGLREVYIEPTFSSSGEKVFFVTRRGDLTRDADLTTLWVFNAMEINAGTANEDQKATVQPNAMLERAVVGPVSAKKTGIFSAKWAADESALTFVGSDQGGQLQVYRFSLGNQKVETLTKWEGDINMGAVWQSDAFILANMRKEIADAPSPYPYHVIRSDLLRQVFLKELGVQTIASLVGEDPWELKEGYIARAGQVEFSTDGHRAIALCQERTVPRDWVRIYGGDGNSSLFGDHNAKYEHFTYIDGDARSDRKLINAPTGRATTVGNSLWQMVTPKAMWVEDDRHAVLVNVAKPHDGGKADSQMAYIIGCDTKTGAWEIIDHLASFDGEGRKWTVISVEWALPGKTLKVTRDYEGAKRELAYTFENGRWHLDEKVPAKVVTKPQTMRPRLEVRVREDMNMAPTVVANDGGENVALTPPDPALEHVEILKTEIFEWNEPSGKKARGGLLLPGRSRGPFPLVINAYYFEPEKFKPDGSWKSFYAAQALAAKGFAVLSINLPGASPERIRGPQELIAFRERIDAACGALVERGIIDINRVGVVGFSRAGFNIISLITKPGKVRPAAAIVDDSWSGTFAMYLQLEVAGPSFGSARMNWEKLYGDGASFWQNKKAWMENEPTFNMDRVSTPTLFAQHAIQNAFLAADVMGAFQLTRRPLEYLLFPGAGHGLGSPRQRYAGMQLTVDWMTFWLNGTVRTEVNPDAGETEEGLRQQFERWQQIKDSWEAQQKWEAAGNPIGSEPKTN